MNCNINKYLTDERSISEIGDFAKIFDINIKTVRYYESIGLIIPAYVDIYSGYRYFNEENIKRMNKINRLDKINLFRINYNAIKNMI